MATDWPEGGLPHGEHPRDYTFGPTDLEGAYIKYVEKPVLGSYVWKVAFGFRGTDDGAGHLYVHASDIHFDGPRIK